MTAKLAEKRRDHRVKAALPVILEGATGVTGDMLPVSLGNATGILRDMSASGAFFWISGTYAIGEEISFSIELETPKGRMMWTCRGDVLRTEPRGRGMGIAVRIVEEELELT